MNSKGILAIIYFLTRFMTLNVFYAIIGIII